MKILGIAAGAVGSRNVEHFTFRALPLRGT